MNEETLISYLYGESNAEERVEVEKYFMENPSELVKYKELLFVKETMGRVVDKEVIAPPLFMSDEKPAIRLWNSGFIRFSIGIAAALVIVMFGAKLMGVQMNYSGNEFTMSFGEPVVKEADSGVSPNEVQDMINTALHKNNQAVQASWEDSQSRMHEELKMNSQLTTKKINEINQAAALESQEQIRRFIQNLQVENSQTLQNYIQLSTADQKQYIESLLVDFSKYMQEQRNQDWNIMNARLNTLEEDNSLFRQEAGEILTSLITDNNSTVKRN
jgi:hypothetical protein